MRRILESFSKSAPIALLALGFSGCVTPGGRARPSSTTAVPVVSSQHPPRRLFVFIPQTEESAISILKLFDKEPKLRLVLAVSPRFKKFSQDAALQARVQALLKQGKLELALQLPNAPLLPLVVDTNSAKDALPAGAPLPQPPFANPDDVIQLIARSKADFFHAWRVLPRGLVLPYGAASPGVLILFDRLGFAWMVAALEAAVVDGPYKAGSFQLWDATPAAQTASTRVLLWDERSTKDPRRTAVLGWIQELTTTSEVAWLPSDSGAEASALPADTAWHRRTWGARNWSDWIGSPKKNAAWEALRKTREALEAYKNSGQASVQRLDLAFEEMFTAENANYLYALDNPAVPAASAEEREHELQATLAGAYRLMNQTPPDDLFSIPTTAVSTGAAAGGTLASFSHLTADGSEQVHVEDPAQDDHGDGHLPDPPGGLPAGSYDLRSFDVAGSSTEVRFRIGMGTVKGSSLGSPGNSGPLIDVYIDQNREPNIGTLPLLPGRRLNASVTDAWEYAVSLYKTQAVVYRTKGGAAFEEAGRFPIQLNQGGIEWSIPRTLLRGSPRRWGYQVLIMAYDTASTVEPPLPYRAAGAPESTVPVYDFLDPSSQSPWLSDITSGRRTEVPFIRPKPQP
jgi:hypothetical protein